MYVFYAYWLLNSFPSQTPAATRTASFSEPRPNNDITPAKKPKPGVPPGNEKRTKSRDIKEVALAAKLLGVNLRRRGFADHVFRVLRRGTV